MTPQEANYRTAAEGEPSCAGCENFYGPDKCKLVEGTVSAAGTCDFFSAPQDETALNAMFTEMLNG